MRLSWVTLTDGPVSLPRYIRGSFPFEALSLVTTAKYLNCMTSFNGADLAMMGFKASTLSYRRQDRP